MVLIVVAVTKVDAEKSVNPDGVFFDESVPVTDDTLAEVHGTGIPTPTPQPRGDAAVILWDEQPKTNPAPSAPVQGDTSS